MTAPAGGGPVRAVIFDLDGTLVQTRAASWEVFAQISNRFDLGVNHPEEFFDLFRGNVFTSIERLCRDDAQAAEVKAAFLALLRDEYTPPMVPGMPDVVRRLASDCTLAVMSSNAMQVMRRVLVAHDIAFCFAHVFGGDVAPDKRAAIRAFLADSGACFGRRCAADYDETGRQVVPEPGSTVLVTDTAGDVRDALETGIRVIGVAWGMHPVDELRAAGAEFVALWPQELTAYVLGDAAAEPATGSCAVRSTETNGSAVDTAAQACACGCAASAAVGDPAPGAALREAGSIRRARRRSAVLGSVEAADRATGSLPAPPSSGRSDAELLAAVRRVCRA